jgi:hypothetical protein
MYMYPWCLMWAIMAVSLSGCAVGQKFSYDNITINLGSAGAAGNFSIAVLDFREYVKSGNKSENFVGLSRGGFGNPFDVETRSGSALASEMAAAIAASLQGKGAKVQTVIVRPGDGPEGSRQALLRTGHDRLLLFTLHEWKTDTMFRTSLDFDLNLDVFNGGGKSLGTSRVSGREVSGGSILSAEKDSQRWFAAKVYELLRDKSVSSGLQQTKSSEN